MTEKEKTYIISHENGTRRKITVPEDWKVTFGPAVKGSRASESRSTYKMPMALRFYESETKQRAIFTDVKSFRDTSIKIEEERVSTQEKEGYTEVDGVRKKTTFHASTKEWVDPDEVGEVPLIEKPDMPEDDEIF